MYRVHKTTPGRSRPLASPPQTGCLVPAGGQITSFTGSALQKTLSELKDDDWVGKRVLEREAPLFAGVAELETAGSSQRSHLRQTSFNPHSATQQLQPWTSAQSESTDAFLQGLTQDSNRSAIHHESPVSQDGSANNTMNFAAAARVDRRPLTHTAKPDSKFHCEFDNFNQSFSRRSDRERHVKSRHSQGMPYACPAEGCFKGQSPTRFARGDKLADHIRAVHWHHDKKFRCVWTGCDGQQSLSLEELDLHNKVGHQALSSKNGYLRRSASAIHTVSKKRRCPVWTCGKSVRFNKNIAHLYGHSDAEFDSAAEALRVQGYVVVQACLSSEVATSSIHRRLTLEIQCPVLSCRANCADHESFAHHLVFGHLAEQSEAAQDHLSQWSGKVQELRRHNYRNDFPWILKFWASRRYLACPACPFKSSDMTRDQETTHQKAFFRPNEDVIAELEPSRLQLLRLCPEFYKHPLYDYLRSTSAAGVS